MDRGVVYAVSTCGEDTFIEEAVRSARSVKEHTDLPVTLFANENPQSKYIDEFHELEDPHFSTKDRILPLTNTPYDQTLSIDTDTYITQDITPMFDLLDRFDLAASHATYPELREVNTPEPFIELNTGVLLYNNTPAIMELFRSWDKIHDKHLDKSSPAPNQPAFREALYHSDINFYVLPPEYNCRFVYPGAVSDHVKILHGRHPDIEAMAETLNADTRRRAFTGNHHRRIYQYPVPVTVRKYPGPGRIRYALQTVKRHIEEDGVKKTFEQMLERFPRLLQ